MISWDICKEDFRWDGSLRDIYIAPASLDDWKAIFPFLCGQPGAEFLTGPSDQNITAEIDASYFNGVRPTLRLRVGGISVIFHFFTPDEIECNIDPREVVDQATLDELLGFLGRLGDLTRKRAILTPENLREEPIISYDPQLQRFEYHPWPHPKSN